MNRADGEITLTGVVARGFHGVLAEERDLGQEFRVDVLARLPFPATDDLALTANYAEMAELICDIVAGEPRDLIETLVQDIADQLMDTFLVLSSVQVTVHKPEAPIAVPFGDVAVTVHRHRTYRVVLSLGSNQPVGELTPREILDRAVDRLGEQLTIQQVSPLYETAAWGKTDQPDFLNCVVIAESALAPEATLDVAQQVEQAFRRTRDIHWGPRTLDVDMVNLYDAATGQEIPVATQRLTVPHPYASERDFVLVPWADSAPGDLLGGVPVRDVLASRNTPAPASGASTESPAPGVRLVAGDWR